MIIIVKRCANCPFCQTVEGKPHCKASVVELRPISEEDEERPSWCPLRREQLIIREFS